MNKLRKGMVLAAGLGTRLLPITDHYPKPVVPVLNIPNLLHTLFLMERAGVEEVIINLFHLPQKIENFIRNMRHLKLKVSYSKEEVLMGTGGGVKKAEAFFEGEPFLLANCDFVSNVDIAPFIKNHFDRNAMATMVLFENAEMQALYSKVGTDSKSHLCSLPKSETSKPDRFGIFTGIHILSNEVLGYLKETPSGINDVLYPHLMKTMPDRVFGDYLKDAYWHDTGDIPALWKASLSLLESVKQKNPFLSQLWQRLDYHYEEVFPNIWIEQGAKIPHPSVTLKGPVVIGKGTEIGQNASIGPSVIIGEDVTIDSGSKASEMVILAHAKLNGKFEKGVFFEEKMLPAKKPA